MERTGNVDRSRLTPPERLELISQLRDILEDEEYPAHSEAQRDESDHRLLTLEADRHEGVRWEHRRTESERRSA